MNNSVPGLHEHLVQQDRDDSRSEEASEIIDEWRRDISKVSDTLSDEVDLPVDLHAIVVNAIISGNWDRVSGWFQDLLTQKWEEAAAQEADQRVAQSWTDAAEAKENSRE